MKVQAVIVLSLLLVIPAFSQKIDDGWKGVLPVKSTRTDVEKVFGKGNLDDLKGEFEYKVTNRFVYRNDETVVRVTYAEKQCDARDGYRVNVPDGTVLRYSVSFKRPKKLSGFRFNADRFVRWPNTGPSYFCYYQTPEKSDVFPPSEPNPNVVPNEAAMRWGIWFEGETIRNRDFITSLYYVMPWGEPQRHSC